MSIPLDRLYHFVDRIAKQINQDHVLIYRFWPHGSKNINNLCLLAQRHDVALWPQLQMYPRVICNDQEPLRYDYYHNITVFDRQENQADHDSQWLQLLKSRGYDFPFLRNLSPGGSIYSKSILLHSEQRSLDIEKYSQDRFIPAYYWSHALIALEWFRYAQHISQYKRPQKKFLIYNRAWSGTREYRLKFAEYLIQQALVQHCQTTVNAQEPELKIHYDQHRFDNPKWKPNQILENYFDVSTATGHYSADFDLEDYENTDIEIVLETLFDDSRLHLTEKSLRPIACGQPFLLAATHGSLQYLRSYGFKTFDHVWDESYDLVEDPADRLVSIVQVMKQISQWSEQERQDKLLQAQAVADHNRKHFFSPEFMQQITKELTDNLVKAFAVLRSSDNYEFWIKDWSSMLSHSEITSWLQQNQNPAMPTLHDMDSVMKFAVDKLRKSNNDST